ncbi:MAG: Crp/Fnr family transcriptional regulator [Oscillospiraceae bacterium]
MKDLSILTKNALFIGLSMREITDFLSAIPCSEKVFQPEDILVHEGDVITHLGIILSGLAVGKKYGLGGEEIIVSRLSVNKIFGDVLSGANGFASPVTVQACEVCRVLFIDYKSLLYSPHSLNHKILQNMIQNISLKYFAQNMRLDILMLKSVREKVLVYLNYQRTLRGNSTFEINLDRRLLSDYLGVDRSALSRELSKMKADGLIDFKKSVFTLKY